MAQPQPRRYPTTGTIARLLGLSKRFVANLIDTGKIDGHRLPGSESRRADVREVLRFAKDNGMVTAELTEYAANAGVLSVYPPWILCVSPWPELPAAISEAGSSVQVARDLFAAAQLAGQHDYDAALIDTLIGTQDSRRLCDWFAERETLVGVLLPEDRGDFVSIQAALIWQRPVLAQRVAEELIGALRGKRAA